MYDKYYVVIRRRAVRQMDTDVSEDRTASIFRVEERAKQEKKNKQQKQGDVSFGSDVLMVV
jgi:hypothetical protein